MNVLLSGNTNTESKKIVVKKLKQYKEASHLQVTDPDAKNELVKKIGSLIKETNKEIKAMEFMKPKCYEMTFNYKTFQEWL